MTIANCKLTGWVRMLRVPNLFTVPGDPLAGFVIAAIARNPGTMVPLDAFWRLLPAIAASLLLYCAGLLANDYFDLAEDRRDRPDRPLPSGIIKPITVISVAVVLAILGVVAGWLAGGLQGLAIAAALAGAIFLYDAGGKRLAGGGPINMGLCRGLSVLIGTSALGLPLLDQYPALIFAVGETLYIAAVTAVAVRETRSGSVGAIRVLPAVTMAMWMVAFQVSFLTVLAENIVLMSLQILAAGWAISCSRILRTAAEPIAIQRTVGWMIRGLLLVQASVAAATGMWQGYVAAGVLLAFWPMSTIASRRLYAS